MKMAKQRERERLPSTSVIRRPFLPPRLALAVAPSVQELGLPPKTNSLSLAKSLLIASKRFQTVTAIIRLFQNSVLFPELRYTVRVLCIRSVYLGQFPKLSCTDRAQ